MSTKISSLLPAGEAVFGSWIQDRQRDGDVAIYAHQHGTVIAQNVSYKDAIEFSDMAIILAPDETARVQWADDDGKAQSATIAPEVLRSMLLDLLRKAKALASGK